MRQCPTNGRKADFQKGNESLPPPTNQHSMPQEQIFVYLPDQFQWCKADCALNRHKLQGIDPAPAALEQGDGFLRNVQRLGEINLLEVSLNSSLGQHPAKSLVICAVEVHCERRPSNPWEMLPRKPEYASEGAVSQRNSNNSLGSAPLHHRPQSGGTRLPTARPAPVWAVQREINPLSYVGTLIAT